ncbi:MAG: quinolinate synthase NadA [Thermotogae bacterium]|nr:quinolinate synthase NadA [Thermotogota bacterium]
MYALSKNDEIREIQREILRLKREKSAYIIAHNYQLPEIQDVADYVGDSLGMAMEAKKTDHPMVVVCGVHFMAETAAILLPDRKVITPERYAGCSLAESITPEQLKEWKKQHPEAVVVAYVNTTAEVKALADYTVTSSNAVDIVRSIPEDKEILFLPDMFLGMYVREVTGRRNMYIWPGECHVHARVSPQDIARAALENPGATMLVHPECGCSTNCLYLKARGELSVPMEVLSTGGMVRYVKNNPDRDYVIATEVGILYRLQKEIGSDASRLKPLREDMVCEYMKTITAEKLLKALEKEQYEVKVPPEIAERARVPIERMLALSSPKR